MCMELDLAWHIRLRWVPICSAYCCLYCIGVDPSRMPHTEHWQKDLPLFGCRLPSGAKQPGCVHFCAGTGNGVAAQGMAILTTRAVGGHDIVLSGLRATAGELGPQCGAAW